ncbi:MAG: RsbRD N-terminal domain-containing protein [Nitrospirota bacterium]
MNLKDLLRERRPSITKRWFDSIVESYPADASNFFRHNRNRFTNPVGHTFAEVIGGIFDELLQGCDPEKYFPYLNDLIKIRAVQDFTPSQAVSFIFLLKRVIRDELGAELRRDQFHDELNSLELEIDRLALLSFDVYVKCRERISELRMDEFKRMTFRLLKTANLVHEIPQQELKEDTVLTHKIEG